MQHHFNNNTFIPFQPFYASQTPLTLSDPCFYAPQHYPITNLDFAQSDYETEPLIRLNKNSKKIAKQPKSESPSSSKSKSPKARAVRNLWKPNEDKLLLELYAQHGPKWTLIGRLIGGRACKQVRDRYLNNLRPDINNCPFSQQEDELLVSLYYQLGSKWKDIAERMAGRTQSQVKNRFYLHLKDSLTNFKMNPFGIAKNDSTSTVDTENGGYSEDQSPTDYNALNRREDEGFGFISYNQHGKTEAGFFQAKGGILKKEEDTDEVDFGFRLNLVRDTSYKFESNGMF